MTGRNLLLVLLKVQVSQDSEPLFPTKPEMILKGTLRARRRMLLSTCQADIAERYNVLRGESNVEDIYLGSFHLSRGAPHS